MRVSKVFQVLIVCSNHSPGAFPQQLFEHSLGNGATYLRLGTCSELVYEDECPSVGLSHHVLHVEQMAGVCRQVILKALLVADVYHYIVEDTGCRAVANRYAESTLQHVLQQPYSLQAHRLSAGVRT